MRKKKKGPELLLGEREAGLLQAINVAGSGSALARKLGITPSAVLDWKRIPANRLLKVEEVTKIPRERLRPDLYRK
jgi:DNA-binding transcriptional regulator YdaS (Cro superfamily)